MIKHVPCAVTQTSASSQRQTATKDRAGAQPKLSRQDYWRLFPKRRAGLRAFAGPAWSPRVVPQRRRGRRQPCNRVTSTSRDTPWSLPHSIIDAAGIAAEADAAIARSMRSSAPWRQHPRGVVRQPEASGRHSTIWRVTRDPAVVGCRPLRALVTTECMAESITTNTPLCAFASSDPMVCSVLGNFAKKWILNFNSIRCSSLRRRRAAHARAPCGALIFKLAATFFARVAQRMCGTLSKTRAAVLAAS